jgi:hypothetical protein
MITDGRRRQTNTEKHGCLPGGLTLGHHSGTNTFSGERVPLSVTNGGFRGAFGVAFRAGQRMEISPELRLNGFFVDNDSDPVSMPSFGIRVGWTY